MLFFLVLFAAGPLAADAPSPVTALLFAPDGEILVAASQQGLATYSWPKLELIKCVKPPFSHLHDLAFSRDGTRLAIAGGEPQEKGGVEIVEWPGLKPVQRVEAGNDVVYTAAWSGDGKSLAMACADKTVRLYDLASGKSKEITDHSAAVLCVLFVPQSKESGDELLITGGRDQTIRVFDAASARPIRVLDNHTATVNDLALRPARNGELPLVASAGQDKTVRFWQPSIGRPVRFAKVPSLPLCVRWLLSGDYVAVACTDGNIRVIDWQTLRFVLEKKTSEGWLTSLAVSPDGTHAVVGDEQGELHAVSLDGIKRQ
ncbi:MAG: WD40 repeat domain-containing protein [Pirellulaceae bacterium]